MPVVPAQELPQLDATEGTQVTPALPQVSELLDPDKLEWRLFRVWRMPNGQQYAQHVSQPLLPFWNDLGVPMYDLILAKDERSAMDAQLARNAQAD